MTKQIDITPEAVQLINTLCNASLKGIGLDAYDLVKKMEAWLITAVDKPIAATPPPSISPPNQQPPVVD
jgi:hypothetical protein